MFHRGAEELFNPRVALESWAPCGLKGADQESEQRSKELHFTGGLD